MAPVENITYMDDSLYKAAARGEIEEIFKNHRGIELGWLKTPNRNNVLHVNLVAGGSINFIQYMLKECPSLLQQANAQGRTPLHVAARHGDSNIVRFLIKFLAECAPEDLEGQETTLEAMRRTLRMTDSESDTALHVAARHGHVGVVQELVKFEDPAYSYSINKNQETPVHMAAEKGDGGLLVSEILDKLTSTAHAGPKGRTAFHAAAMSSCPGTTRTILEKIGGYCTRETDENGQTPLHYAAHLGHFWVVEELLKWDKSAAYIADKKSHMTPLLMAARQGDVIIVMKILSFCPGCCEMVDKRGWNFLHFMGARGNLRSIDYGFGQDLFHAKDASGITPEQVYHACFREPGHFNTNQLRELKGKIMKLLDDAINEEVAGKEVKPYSFSSIEPTKSDEKLQQNVEKEPEGEEKGNAEDIKKANDQQEKEKKMGEIRQSHSVVATLIATVTFTAAITVPGGYKSTEIGPNQGTPLLLPDAAFITFLLSDALAFFCSMVAIVLHFRVVQKHGDPSDESDLKFASKWIVSALNALMLAFYTAIFAILRPSLGIAIFTLCVSIIFHLYILFLDQKLRWDIQQFNEYLRRLGLREKEEISKPTVGPKATAGNKIKQKETSLQREEERKERR